MRPAATLFRMRDIQDQLRAAVKAQGLTVRDLAARVDLPATTLHAKLTGLYNFTLPEASAIARQLGFELVLRPVPGETP